MAPLSATLLALVPLAAWGCGTRTEPSALAQQPRFIDSTECVECHRTQADAWRGSHHDLAMQPALESTVLGDFAEASFESQGLTTRFFRRDGGFWVNTEGPDGELHDYAIRYTFGADPLQQYLVEFPGGRLQCLTVAWDTRRGRWFSLYPLDRFEPDDELHWTGRYQNWNLMCAECHSTHLRKNYDAASDSYDTSWHELDVTCQACHGPGGEHVNRARAAGADWNPDPDETGLVTTLRRDLADQQLGTCAPCHSRRLPLTKEPQVGANFFDHFALESLRAPLYHADGQMIDEVYVLGSFLQSKMHDKGVVCTDCHDPHSLELLRPDNGVCLQCHSPFAPLERFPSLTQKDYDSEEHHHHAPGSQGALCRNCHMPARTYMQVDERFDHSFRIPRPDLTEMIGTPNTCTACHTDQSAGWAADAIRAWTGRDPEPHRGVIFAAASAAFEAVASPLAGIALDPEQPAIVRATALDLLGAYPGGSQIKLMAAEDSEPLVRAFALEGLGDLPAELLVERVRPLLGDPVRSVRIAAALALAGPAGQSLAQAGDTDFLSARSELLASFDAMADAPSTSLNLGIYRAAEGDHEGAVEAYRRALKLDRDFSPALFNLANLLSTIGREEEAKTLLQDAIARHPRDGELRYSLGLLLAQMGQLEPAADALGAATRLLPERARMHYNQGLLAQQLGRTSEAERALLRASELEPENPDFLFALADFYRNTQRPTEALLWAEQLGALLPGAPGPQSLIEELRTGIGQPVAPREDR